jgi:Major Facilitator Superfamily
MVRQSNAASSFDPARRARRNSPLYQTYPDERNLVIIKYLTAQLSSRLAELLDPDEDARTCAEIPEEACREQPRNRVIHITALTLTKVGDSLVDAKLTLTWLMATLGAPAFMLGLLVPLRESLALLPQLAVGQWIREHPVRKGFWIIGSLTQAGAIFAMAIVAATLEGAPAGWSILAALIFFALGRGITSVASKDVLGKTIDKQRRGLITGTASSIAGLVSLVLGGLLIVFGAPENRTPLVLLLCAAATIWILACVVYAKLQEFPGATGGGSNGLAAALTSLRLAWTDHQLRGFLLTRTLLISSGLAAPFYVALASENGQHALRGLGILVLMAGLANLLSGRFWGRLADHSSRATMAIGGALCALLSLAVVLVAALQLTAAESSLWYGLVIFIFYLGHSAVRLGRKTYLIDMATAENRAQLVAVSNTLIGVFLLIIGGASSWLSVWGTLPVLVALAVLCFGGSIMAMRLPRVSQD